MKIVIAGASGFIGTFLVDRLIAQSHSLTLLSRRAFGDGGSVNPKWLVWRPGQSGEWEKSVDDADGVINLTGEPIAGKRWSAAQKQELRASRINATRSLVEAI